MKSGAEIVALARQYIGKVSYVFGAQTENFDTKKIGDCSSFTQYIFKQSGYNIPRTCTQVWNTSNPKIERDNLRIGDLVFFTGTYNTPNIASHIGIYSGNGNFIHLATSGLQESGLDESYWNSHYLGAMRIAESEGTISSGATGENTEEESSLGLVWWGDIVKIVLIILLVIIACSMLVLGVKGTVFDNITGG